VLKLVSCLTFFILIYLYHIIRYWQNLFMFYLRCTTTFTIFIRKHNWVRKVSFRENVLKIKYDVVVCIYMKGYKSEVTNPQNCKKLVSHFIQRSKQRFILCQTWLTVILTVQCCNLVNFSGTKNKDYFIFNFTLKYLNFSVLWVSHLWLLTLYFSVWGFKRCICVFLLVMKHIVLKK
jgi:hypothetical protein